MDLEERISSDIKFFDSMLELIPPAFYFPPEVNENQWANQFAHNKKDKAPKQAVKETSKKGKKAKFNDVNKSLPELQQERIAAEGARLTKERETDVEKAPTASANPQAANSLAELKERLQAKILKLRGKRKHDEDSKDASERSSRNDDRKAMQNKKRKLENGSAQRSDHTTVAEKGTETKLVTKDVAPTIIPSANMEFSAINFDTDEKKRKKRGNLESLLEKAKATTEKMKELEHQEGGELIAQEAKWKTLMNRASGDKGDKDDVKLLKKALKRKEKKKQKSAAEWAVRKAEVEEVVTISILCVTRMTTMMLLTLH